MAVIYMCDRCNSKSNRDDLRSINLEHSFCKKCFNRIIEIVRDFAKGKIQ